MFGPLSHCGLLASASLLPHCGPLSSAPSLPPALPLTPSLPPHRKHPSFVPSLHREPLMSWLLSPRCESLSLKQPPPLKQVPIPERHLRKCARV
jgi:hypothetical protein